MTNSYFYTYNAVFDVPMSGFAKLVYAYLCKCADQNGRSYPTHKVIGSACGIAVSTVKKALTEIESAGLISVQGQARPDSGRRANIYTIIKEAVKGFFLTYGNVFIKSLTPKARLVYLYFCRLASGNERAFPAHKTTAIACGLSVAGTRAAIDELESAGLIERKAQYRENGGQRANLYTLVIDPNNSNNGTSDERKTEKTEINAIDTFSLNESCADAFDAAYSVASESEKNDESALQTEPVVQTANILIMHDKSSVRKLVSKLKSFISRHIASGIVVIKHPPLPSGGYWNYIYKGKYP